MKVDLEQLKRLQNQLADMERRLENIVINATKESTRIAQNTKTKYREYDDVIIECEAVISASTELRNQGIKISQMLQANVKGLNFAIGRYHQSEELKSLVNNMFRMWRERTFARAFRIACNSVPASVAGFGNTHGKKEYLRRKRLNGSKGSPNKILPFNAINYGWGPISEDEYDRRLRQLLRINDYFIDDSSTKHKVQTNNIKRTKTTEISHPGLSAMEAFKLRSDFAKLPSQVTNDLGRLFREPSTQQSIKNASFLVYQTHKPPVFSIFERYLGIEISSGDPSVDNVWKQVERLRLFSPPADWGEAIDDSLTFTDLLEESMFAKDNND